MEPVVKGLVGSYCGAAYQRNREVHQNVVDLSSQVGVPVDVQMKSVRAGGVEIRLGVSPGSHSTSFGRTEEPQISGHFLGLN